jgi:GDP-4-dehydro-6-deoxy-D-mannose reductase
MTNKMIRIGITGSTGVLGSILLRKLKKKNYKVACFRSDIRKIEKIRSWVKKNNFDAIFHLASIVPVNLCNKNPLNACYINIGGTKNILETISKLKKKPWFFYASTSHVYKLKKTPLSENDIISPRTFYGYTKWLGEKLLENQTLNSGLNYCIGRIFSFYSNSQSKDFLYPSLKNKIKKMSNKNNIYVLNAYNVIDIQKADSVVNIILRLFEKKAEGVFNIGTGKGMQIKNFAKKLTTKKIIVKTNSKKKNTVIANIKKLNSIIDL